VHYISPGKPEQVQALPFAKLLPYCATAKLLLSVWLKLLNSSVEKNSCEDFSPLEFVSSFSGNYFLKRNDSYNVSQTGIAHHTLKQPVNGICSIAFFILWYDV